MTHKLHFAEVYKGGTGRIRESILELLEKIPPVLTLQKGWGLLQQLFIKDMRSGFNQTVIMQPETGSKSNV